MERYLFAGQLLPERGEDIGQQDVARRVVGHDRPHTDREVARAARHPTDIGRDQRVGRVLLADYVYQCRQQRIAFLRRAWFDVFRQ